MENLTLQKKPQLKYELIDWWYDKDNKGKSITVLQIDTDYNFLELCDYIENKYPNKEYYIDSSYNIVLVGRLKKELI